MNWQKASEHVMQSFDDALPLDAAVQRRKMFGFPSAFVNGNMFAGVYQNDIVVRLPPELRTEAISRGGRQFEPEPGRRMREYVVVPLQDVEAQEQLSRWLHEAFQFVATMPVKQAKARAKKAAAKPNP